MLWLLVEIETTEAGTGLCENSSAVLVNVCGVPKMNVFWRKPCLNCSALIWSLSTSCSWKLCAHLNTFPWIWCQVRWRQKFINSLCITVSPLKNRSVPNNAFLYNFMHGWELKLWCGWCPWSCRFLLWILQRCSWKNNFNCFALSQTFLMWLNCITQINKISCPWLQIYHQLFSSPSPVKQFQSSEPRSKRKKQRQPVNQWRWRH